MQLEIREARPDDAEAVVRILNPIIAAGVYTVFDTPFTPEAEREYIRNLTPRGIFHVAISQPEREVVGFQTMEPFAGYTHAFDHVGIVGTYVDLGRRRQGIATRLFKATFAAALRKGYEKVFTFVRADNPAALRAYTRQGFRIVGTAHRQARLRGEDIDEIVIEKILTGSTGIPRQSIGHVALVVRDYDEAIRFYTEKLNFTLVEDTYRAEQDKRWVVVAPPGSNGTTVLLARASTAEQETRIGNQTGGRVFLFLSTDDFWRDYHRMSSAGLTFVRPPSVQAYGTVAVFQDLYGNLWDLVEWTTLR
jgi:L-amino acid N-acyltransferase YncA/catechol 2,3-dioxygenase-like lactoylglutathione lyase family enzyme